jgi:uncharacterized protein YegL
MWAFKRRLNIILLILATVLCFGIIPYYLSHREVPTCFDGKQNQNEEGIDCGGGCALVCKGKAKDLKVLWTKIDEIRPGVSEVAFAIENSNVIVGAKNIPYTVTLYGARGEQLEERHGTTFAGPNEAFLIYEGNIKTKEGQVLESAELSFGEFAWVTTSKQDNLFTVEDKRLEFVDTRPKLSAVVHSESPFLQEHVEVDAIISDDVGEVIGYGKTYIESLPPHETRGVTFSWTKPFTYQASLESCDVPVDAMLVFDRSGSMQSDGKNPPEPLTTAKNAASAFVQKFRSQDQIGVVSFATSPTIPIDRVLTNDKLKVRTSVDEIVIGTNGTQYTNIGDALKQAYLELESRRRNPNATPAVILLTDGDPTYPEHPEDKNYPLFYAQQEAKKLRDKGITLYTIGLGGDVKGEYLSELAGDAQRYFSAASASDLSGIYTKISSVLCKKAPSVIEVLPRVNSK